jgi:lipid-binding SYLF domain-containing protein
MKLRQIFATCLIAATVATPAFAASSRSDLTDRLNSAKEVLDKVMAISDNGIPLGILQKATCVGVVPSLIKGAFIFGAQYGNGVVTCRTEKGWSAPVFIRLAGGSFGFQIGGQATDLVLVAVNQKGFQDLLRSKFKIGGDVSASAGPVGRTSQASTDWKMNSELLTYSRSRGLFAGIDLDGTTVTQNSADTHLYYGKDHDYKDILEGGVGVPAEAKPFVAAVIKYFVEAQGEKARKDSK